MSSMRCAVTAMADFQTRGLSRVYRVLNAVSEIDIPIDSGDFSLMDRTVVDAINALPEGKRFVRGLRAWVGYRQLPLPYDRPARRLGRTNYSFAKLLRLAVDGIFDFSTKPLTIIYLVGLVASVASLSGFLFFLAHRVIGSRYSGIHPKKCLASPVSSLPFSFSAGSSCSPWVCSENTSADLSRSETAAPFHRQVNQPQSLHSRIGPRTCLSR